jgi:hypothetical protein
VPQRKTTPSAGSIGSLHGRAARLVGHRSPPSGGAHHRRYARRRQARSRLNQASRPRGRANCRPGAPAPGQARGPGSGTMSFRLARVRGYRSGPSRNGLAHGTRECFHSTTFVELVGRLVSPRSRLRGGVQPRRGPRWRERPRLRIGRSRSSLLAIRRGRGTRVPQALRGLPRAPGRRPGSVGPRRGQTDRGEAPRAGRIASPRGPRRAPLGVEGDQRHQGGHSPSPWSGRRRGPGLNTSGTPATDPRPESP